MMLQKFFDSLNPSKSIKYVLIFTIIVCAQYSKTASEIVPHHTDVFRWGTNPGWVSGWSDQQRADLIAGNSTTGIPGTGANSLRGSLPHHFVEKWGVDINVADYKYYGSLGIEEMTVFIGGVAEEYQSTKYHCAETQSKMWRNMYTPIWDAGENGTPINDTNYFAKYIYDVAQHYGEFIRYWEVINEPDFTSSDAGWGSVTDEHNWYNTDPDPCDLPNIAAPIEYYVRALHIAYEVIKARDETDYVCLGGIGYVNFMDALLRNSDNPVDGAVTDEYPHLGGAWFDCVSFHTYPMYKLSRWGDGERIYFRHSDAAIDVIDTSAQELREVLKTFGYDGVTYPEKRLIITETNIPRVQLDDHIGSDAAQYNFLSKLYVKAQVMGLDQVHTYALFDNGLESEATDPYAVMGFYNTLSDIAYGDQVETNAAVALRTLAQQLEGYHFSSDYTEQLALPTNTDGAAFIKDGALCAVLWAKTDIDLSEDASVNYPLPQSLMGTEKAIVYPWNATLDATADTIELDAAIQLQGSIQYIKIINSGIMRGDSLSSSGISESSGESSVSSSTVFSSAAIVPLTLIERVSTGPFIQLIAPGESLEIEKENMTYSVYTLMGEWVRQMPQSRDAVYVVMYRKK